MPPVYFIQGDQGDSLYGILEWRGHSTPPFIAVDCNPLGYSHGDLAVKNKRALLSLSAKMTVSPRAIRRPWRA
jgi:hypothetical protein